MKYSNRLISALFTLLLLAGLAHAAPNVTQLPGLELYPLKDMVPNGEYEVFVLKDGAWNKAGSLSCDRFFRERKLELGSEFGVGSLEFGNGKGDTIKLRIVQKGGGAAHIDSAFLGGASSTRIQGSDDPRALQKMSKKDFDVIDAYSKSIELTFPGDVKDRTLVVTGRIESKEIGKTPFHFPIANLRTEMSEHSQFYTYQLNSGTNEKAFFKEFSPTGSGHPSGFTYGRVTNDDKNLYVKIDFTPDNTMDGSKDYAKVYVKTGSGMKEFKASVPETTWGKPDFTYTDKVSYQHKVYEFAIPFKELELHKEKTAKEMKLAFAAYGTAEAGYHFPAVAYDLRNNRYLVVFEKRDEAGLYYDIAGQFINHDGTKIGSNFVISNASNHQYGPSVAYDGVNETFLVAWQDYRSETSYDIYGQMVDAAGTLTGSNFVISDAADTQGAPSVAYDSVNQRFLVAWGDSRSGLSWDIYGQLVGAAGTLTGSNFVISDAVNSQYYPCVAYDSANQRFLVAWGDSRISGTNYDIYGQLVNAAGTLSGSNFVISNASDNQNNPSVAYDSANHTFLVAWDDYRNEMFYTIYAQLVNAAGTLSGSNFVISNALTNQVSASVSYNNVNQMFIVAWEDKSISLNSNIYGQLVNAAGTPNGSNFFISNASVNEISVSGATNSLCGNFVAVYDSETAVPELGVALVGSACETTPPAVSSTNPAASATDIAIASTISAVFSEPVRTTTVTAASTFTVKDSGGNEVAGTVTYDSDSKTATFTPSANLASSITYTATIVAGVKDLVGNALSADYNWSFTTEANNPPAANNPPTAPTLVSPANGATGLGTNEEFRWKKTTDPDGDTVTYHLSYCTDQNFSGCTPVDVALSGANKIYFAGLGAYGGLMIIGIVFAGTRKGRQGLLLLIVVVLLATGSLLAACGSSGGSSSASDEMTYTASGLTAGTTYYWKVAADDGNGGTAESAVWSFATE